MVNMDAAAKAMVERMHARGCECAPSVGVEEVAHCLVEPLRSLQVEPVVTSVELELLTAVPNELADSCTAPRGEAC